MRRREVTAAIPGALPARGVIDKGALLPILPALRGTGPDRRAGRAVFAGRIKERDVARIAGVNIPSQKQVWVALTYIYGVGAHSSRKLLPKSTSRTSGG